MRTLILLAFPLLLLAGCTSPNVDMMFIVKEQMMDAPPGSPPLHGVATEYGGNVRVFVGDSKTPQTLSLMSESSTIWHVYLFPGANVAKIYVAGLDQQQVVVTHSPYDDAPMTPDIVNLSGNLIGHETLSFGPPMHLTGQKGEDYKTELKRETGLDLTGFIAHPYVCLNCAFAVSMDEHPTDQELNDHFPAAVRRDRSAATRDYKELRDDLSALVERGAIPAQMPLFENTEREESEVRLWALLPPESPTPAGSSKCGVVAIGTPSDDTLWCGEHEGYVPETKWIVGGKGHDIIGDGRELSQVLSGGPGDDIINADLGNDVIYFGDDWGNDVVSMRCLTTPYGDPLPRYQDSRYIVFGRGVRPSNLRWLNAREIEDRSTGSRVRFAGEFCAVRLIAIEAGSLPVRPTEKEEE